MAKVYASLIIKGKKAFHEVPEELKPAVREILIASGHEDLIDE